MKYVCVSFMVLFLSLVGGCAEPLKTMSGRPEVTLTAPSRDEVETKVTTFKGC